ncbi:MAG: hemolysin III family protein [Moraxellaceae bacterium]|nr:hemolysin III family protein [Pseudobdellovibrionaceae bacterium]
MKPLKKPRLRGHLHQAAFFVTLGAGSLLIAKSTSPISFAASVIYVLGLLFLFGVSAVYHIPHWEPQPRAFLKRVDHTAIFILIASTFTPLCLLALPVARGDQLLIIIWSAASLGLIQSFFWVKAPKWVTSILYVVMGWLALPYLGEFKDTLGSAQLLLIVAGGVVYTVGAVFYAMKKPNFVPGVFGYHELFHLFTIVGALFHFIVIYSLVR